ncbi:response regulator [Amaricoccus tamworthensis]|uniref:response regulator n=1 Tax=Amaricoccus tamworthensis TaxID=57002 RepID=UPI003C79B60E
MDFADENGLGRGKTELLKIGLETGGDAGMPVRPDFARLMARYGGSPRVLVVEDDHLIGTDIAHSLRETGYEVVGIANTPDAALDFLAMREGRIDCAVIDIQLDDETSQPVAEQLDQLAIPYVVVTGHTEATVRRLGIDAPVIEKPFDGVRLSADLTSLLLVQIELD